MAGALAGHLDAGTYERVAFSAFLASVAQHAYQFDARKRYRPRAKETVDFIFVAEEDHSWSKSMLGVALSA